jgi:hypothetical protein
MRTIFTCNSAGNPGNVAKLWLWGFRGPSQAVKGLEIKRMSARKTIFRFIMANSFGVIVRNLLINV